MVELSKFHWAGRVSRRDIQRLYASDASGNLDEELLDRVHYSIHARVIDMFEVQEAQKFGRVKCRRCGELVPQPFEMGLRSRNKILKCAKCSWETTCGEFYESYSGKSLLPGSVTDLLEMYLERFPKAGTPSAKMLLIDWLIHQFHVMQGVARMSVAKNVIQGTDEQIRELIETLASGPGSTHGLASLDEWRSVYYNPVRMFKQTHSHSDVQAIAARLGIQGRNRMSEDELIPEILRLAPNLAVMPDETKKKKGREENG